MNASSSVELDPPHEQKRFELINGLQALVHLTLNQRQRDRERGLDTGCFVSGYRGSPLAGLDQRFNEAGAALSDNGIVFQPAINEDLAVTACWGTQQLMLLSEEAEVTGICALWYGKGPGVDRSIDALKHGNNAGASRYGGVLVCAGDDHTAKSSTLGHQSEPSLIAAQIPVLYPSDVQEVLDYGVHGWEIGRQTGSWAALKCVSDVVETTGLVDVRHDRIAIVALQANPPDELFIKGDAVWSQLEVTVVRQRLPRVIRYARLNGLNRVVRKSPEARLGIVSAGKSYRDVIEALTQLEARCGLDLRKIAILKLGLVWPLDPDVINEFAEGLDEILVVEEKRPIIEVQIKDELYGRASQGAKVPAIVGKNDGSVSGEWSTESEARLLRADFELTPQEIADVIEIRVRKLYGSDAFASDYVPGATGTSSSIEPSLVVRRPYFCSGCPHNSSTKIPEGSRATAGIGCSYMASWMNRDTFTYTHMGGEGAPWSAQQHFSKRKHIFANVGDGTFFHSASLSLRQAVASKAPMTFKILFNEAVAMTGGQVHDGHLSPQKLAHMAAAEGVRRIAVVSDDIDKYRNQAESFPALADIYHRSDLDSVQRKLAEHADVSVLIYDQTCATEKRRRRKRGLMPEAPVQVHINPDVCEGCGDCGVKSNCLSVEPITTALGPKRTINQSSCNTDMSCVAGFCPSFVTVERRPNAGRAVRPNIPAVELPAVMTSNLERNLWRGLLAGVGGTGVVSLGAALASSARNAALCPTVLDMAGLAQKGGAVWSHVNLARAPENLTTSRIPRGLADLVLANDLVVATHTDTLERIQRGHTEVVVDDDPRPTADIFRDRDNRPDPAGLLLRLKARAGKALHVVPANRLALTYLGDSIHANTILLGYASQKGLLPVPESAIIDTLSRDGRGAEQGRAAFRLGRIAAVDLDVLLPKAGAMETRDPENFVELSADRFRRLVGYQNKRYATRYQAILREVQLSLAGSEAHARAFTLSVARNLYKVMAYKDEYEVARLHLTNDVGLAASGGDVSRIRYHLAPPLISRRNPAGTLQKREFGPWVRYVFKALAAMKGLRGTGWDLFGRQEERRQERNFIDVYASAVKIAAVRLAERPDVALAIAAVPDQVRGYGHVKQVAMTRALEELTRLQTKLDSPEAVGSAA